MKTELVKIEFTEEEVLMLLKMVLESPIQGNYKTLESVLRKFTAIKNKFEAALK
jgi:hypothetical protein